MGSLAIVKCHSKMPGTRILQPHSLLMVCGAEANISMMQTGVFRTQLNFKQIIGYCALIHSSVISQLGLMDKNDLAWQYANYDKLLDMLRAEFELDKRIRHLQDKIEIVARDAATFVSFQQSDKSHTLEWTVIILIAMEIVVGLIDIWLHFST
jgi:uncharacterized Rmd1/YagE family protein